MCHMSAKLKGLILKVLLKISRKINKQITLTVGNTQILIRKMYNNFTVRRRMNSIGRRHRNYWNRNSILLGTSTKFLMRPTASPTSTSINQVHMIASRTVKCKQTFQLFAIGVNRMHIHPYKISTNTSKLKRER